MDDVTFDGLQLFSLPGRVMTPRVASERLVDAARARIGNRSARVVDVGSGGGAIAIAVALACPRADVWATDNSPSAVLLARANVRRHGLAGRVRVRQGDLLEPVPGSFDLIVANLPYVSAATAEAHPELANEPFDAVFATGDGLAHYRHLVDAAATRLVGDGLLVLQLHRQVVAATFAELPALEATLASPTAVATLTAKEAA